MDNLMLSELSKMVGNELAPIIANLVAEQTAPLIEKVRVMTDRIAELEKQLDACKLENGINSLASTRLNTVELSLINVNGCVTKMGEDIKDNDEALSDLQGELSDIHAKYSALRSEMKHTASKMDEHRLDQITKKLESILTYYNKTEARLERYIEQSDRAARDHNAMRETINILAVNFKKSREETVIDEHRPATITMLQAKVSSLEERMNNPPVRDTPTAPPVNQFELERDLTRLFDLYRLELKKEFGLKDFMYACDQRLTNLEKATATAKEDAPITGSSTGDRDLMSHYDELCVNLSDVRCLIREHRKALDDKMVEVSKELSTLRECVLNFNGRINWVERRVGMNEVESK